MKKNTFYLSFVVIFLTYINIKAQIINEPANWPNTNWVITGSYNTVSGLANDPTLTANFSWDDDLAGSASLKDDISAESPIINLIPAVPTEQSIQVSANYVYRRTGGEFLTLEWHNVDTGNWVVWDVFQSNSTNLDYKDCNGMQTYTSPLLITATFSTTQRLSFKYRLRFNDAGFNWGMCFESPTLISLPTSNCLAVSNVVIDIATITNSQAKIDWTDNNAVPPSNGWEIEYGPEGFTQGTGTIVPVAAHPFTLLGLTTGTSYDVYVRALCTNTEQSDWAGPTSFTTEIAIGDVCGGQFIDSGGTNGEYSDDEDITTTICPDINGEVVTINFLSFDTESNYDFLSIYNGADATAPLLGTFDGTDLPPTFTSTDSTGCLTFVFTSDFSNTGDGWVANIICSLPPTCFAPTNIVVNTVTATSATVTWTDNNTPPPANGWEVEIVLTGTAPTGVGVPTAIASYDATGLSGSTVYDAYVRAVCDDSGTNDPSFWVATSFQTEIAPPECGGIFVDTGGPLNYYGSDENITTVICPDVAGEAVTVIFTTFNTEADYDFLSVFDGPTAASPSLGVYDGTDLPPVFTSTHTSGCLTFVFISDGIFNFPGWEANVLCGPPPTCWWVSNLTVTDQTDTTVDLNWTDNLNAPPPLGGWNIEYGTIGFVQGTGTIVNAPLPNTDFTVTGLIPSTGYDFYIQAQCAIDDTDSSYWIGPAQVTTTDVPPPNDTCITAIPLIVDVDCNYILGNNILATSSSINEGEIAPNCADPLVNGDALDIWYTFEVPITGTVIVETFNAGGMVDSVMAVYTGECGNLVELDCQDDSVIYPNSEFFRFSSIKLTDLTPGDTIFVRVWSYPQHTSDGDIIPNVQGSFNICAYGQPREFSAVSSTNDEVVDNIQLSYYPNPVTNVLNINASKEINEIVLYGILGQEIYRKTAINATNTTVNLQHLSVGTYFVKALINGKTEKFKVIKK